MENIIVTRYEEKLAAGIADMWNRSGSNWGGDEAVKTEKDILKERRNSTDLELFVAVDNGEVVGTCSFAKYDYDENTSYIPLLNVRPDYHGKKVGKKLVLEVVKNALESQWPRLDLFTWPGNTKAVPLYKKCGFFWEKMDKSTHLMNFIPYVMRTEAVKDYFESDLDWYAHSQREIVVEPDGDERGEFEFYQYCWKNENKYLAMEFERKGRGLCLIETEDYLVRVHSDKHKLVFGREYEVFYTIENKSGKELKVDIKGMDDKQVEFSMSQSVNVVDKEVIKGIFKVNEIKEKQNEWKTHPSVKAQVTINGKNAEFKLGVEPLFPVVMEIKDCGKPNYTGTKGEFFLNLDNSYDQDIDIELKLPENEYAEFLDKEIKVKIAAKCKKSIKLPFNFKKEGFFCEDFTMNIIGEDFQQEFSKRISRSLIGMSGKFFGTTDDCYEICNGMNLIRISKRTNGMGLNTISGGDFNVQYPKIGMPFSQEFSSKEADHVEYEIGDQWVMMRLTYSSDDFKGVKIYWINKLHNNGLVESYYEILSDKDMDKLTALMDFRFSLADSYIPYEDGIMRMAGNAESDMEYFQSDKVTENWMFAKDTTSTRGVFWDKDMKVEFKGYKQGLYNELKDIKKDEIMRTSSLYFVPNSFSDYEKFRAFAMKENNLPKLKTIDTTDIIVNGGNPFVDENITLIYKDRKQMKSSVEIKVENKNNEVQVESFDLKHGGEKEIKIDKDIQGNSLKMKIKNNLGMKNKEVLVFKKDEGDVKTEKITLEGKEVLQLDNGVLKMKASKEYHNGIYSLEYMDKEYLDNRYPIADAKGWFNPYTGGSIFKPSNASFLSCFKEKQECEFVQMKDQFGNLWSGIKTSLEFIESEDFKGVTTEQIYLTQPNQPIVVTLHTVKNNSGKYLSETGFEMLSFLNKKEDHVTEVLTRNSENNPCTHRCDGANRDIDCYGSTSYKTEGIDVLNVIHKGVHFHELYTCLQFNMDICYYMANIADNEEKNLGKSIMVISEEAITTEAMRSLENLKFETI